MDKVDTLLRALCTDIDAKRLEEITKQIDVIFTDQCRQQEVILACCYFLQQAYEGFPASGQKLFPEAIKRLIITEWATIH